MTTNLKKVQDVVDFYNGNIEEMKQELKNVQSRKCRQKKFKNRENYEVEMTTILKEEQLLKEAISYVEPKRVFVTKMTDEQIESLNYDETIKAIKSIQSKKCNTQFDKVEYEKACEIELKLLQHKKEVKPVEETVVKKSQIDTLIEEIESLENVSKDYMIEMLKKMKE